jgi:predicted nuclease of predicted toxin-antitoxin system
LLDQDVYSVTARFLLGLGHDVITASDLGLARTSDAALLARAMSDTRILVTRDKDLAGWRSFSTAVKESFSCASLLQRFKQSMQN